MPDKPGTAAFLRGCLSLVACYLFRRNIAVSPVDAKVYAFGMMDGCFSSSVVSANEAIAAFNR